MSLPATIAAVAVVLVAVLLVLVAVFWPYLFGAAVIGASWKVLTR